ncbi:hypothetical protein GWI33_021269 [Rhynchophorus ferrugineus]|uniref:Uncharacterized protein n=1 Tax=Rhynchophorus ferrugineus TaxID=354439 RepID=A0A834M3D2_RHYFE|nr:hypothetical protein GWI33_021269 [Rhynchophorus ferrugineus]
MPKNAREIPNDKTGPDRSAFFRRAKTGPLTVQWVFAARNGETLGHECVRGLLNRRSSGITQEDTGDSRMITNLSQGRGIPIDPTKVPGIRPALDGNKTTGLSNRP